MTKKLYMLISAIVSGLTTIGVGVTTYIAPEYMVAINTSIAAVSGVLIECLANFVKDGTVTPETTTKA